MVPMNMMLKMRILLFGCFLRLVEEPVALRYWMSYIWLTGCIKKTWSMSIRIFVSYCTCLKLLLIRMLVTKIIIRILMLLYGN